MRQSIFSSLIVITSLFLGFSPAYSNPGFTPASQREMHVLVFYNKFCGHCKDWLKTTGMSYDSDAPKRLGTTYPGLSLYDLSSRENYKTYQDLLSTSKLSKPIDAVPTFLVVDDNLVEVKRLVGAVSKDDFYRFVQEAIQ